MENAADALKIAGSVLLFIIALSVSIISFGNVRKSADEILSLQDKETQYIDGNYYYKSDSNELVRTVGIESIIPTIYRVYYENYRIFFDFKNSSNKDSIYINKINNIQDKRYSLDLSYETKILQSASDINPENNTSNYKNKSNILLNAIVYGDKENDEYKRLYQDKIILQGESLIERLRKAKKITEYLGTYYNDYSAQATDTSNKERKKRVITYVIE